MFKLLKYFSSKWVKADGYAPFQSMAGRETMFHLGDSIVAAPGPGAYDPKYDAQCFSMFFIHFIRQSIIK